MNNHPYLAIGQEVIFVGADNKLSKGRISTVYGPDSAQIALEDGGVAVADFSDQNDPGTFYFEQASPKAEP